MNALPIVVNMTVAESVRTVNMVAAESTERIPLNMDSRIVVEARNAEDYHGAYEITPQARAPITLETAGKRMTQDLTVTEIPYFEVSNDSGGTTVNIGG